MKCGAFVVILAVVGLACAGVEPLAAVTTETVKIESLDLPGRLWDPFLPPLSEGRPVTIDGNLTLPTTDRPVPAVIITHGCGGVSGAERGWVDDLVEAGYATLLLDSFAGRGISTVCFGGETVNVASMIIDVFRAADVLREHRYVDGDRLAVVGFSFGGRTALWSALTRVQEAYEGRPLQGHVAFYPSTCFIRLENEHQVSPAPIRIFHGTEDDWTPIDQCQDYVDRIAGSGVDAGLIAFEGARHSFDNETLDSGGTYRLDAPSPRNCQFVEIEGEIIDSDTSRVAGVGSPCVELGVTYAYNADAHRAAKVELLDLLTGVFAQEQS